MVSHNNRDNWLNELMAFDAPFLEEKLLEKGVFASREEYAEAFGEFKRYVALGKLSGKSLAMTSEKVDAVWHQFILFTKEYAQFCDCFVGSFLHHSPALKSAPVSEKSSMNFVDSYRQHFGSIPSIWGHSTKADCGGSDSFSPVKAAIQCTGDGGGGCSGGMMRASVIHSQCVGNSSDSDGDSRNDTRTDE